MGIIRADGWLKYFAWLLRGFGYRVSEVTKIGRPSRGRFEVWFRTGRKVSAMVVDFGKGNTVANQAEGREEKLAVLVGSLRETPEGQRITWRLEKAYTVVPDKLLSARPTKREIEKSKTDAEDNDEVADMLAAV